MLQRATTGASGGKEISNVLFASYRYNDTGTVTFPVPIDEVYVVLTATEPNHCPTGVATSGSVAKGSSETFSGLTITVSADGQTVTRSGSDFNFLVLIGIVYN